MLEPSDNGVLASRAVESLQASAGLGLLAALVWPVPAIFRGGSWDVGGYLALVGGGSLSLFAAALAFRPTAPSAVEARRSSQALTLAACVAVTPLFAFASVLKRVTHHRPLGAVTFAAGALALLVLLGLLMRRALSIAEEASGWVGGAIVPVLQVAAGVSVLWALSALSPSLIHDATVVNVLTDAALGVLLGAVVAKAPARAAESRLLRAALPLCCLLWLASLWLVRADAHVRATVKSVPVVAGAVGLSTR